MFRTNIAAELRPPPESAREGDLFWYFVEVMLRHVWFVASFTLANDGESMPRTAILADLSQLTQLVRDRGAVVNQVVLATPSIINGTDRWLFEELVEAWESDQMANPGSPFLIFVVASGKEYVDTFLSKYLGPIKKQRRLFPVAYH